MPTQAKINFRPVNGYPRRRMPGFDLEHGKSIKELRIAGPLATKAEAETRKIELISSDHMLRNELYVWCQSSNFGVENKMIATREYDLGVVRFDVVKAFDLENGQLVETDKWVVHVDSGVQWLKSGPLCKPNGEDWTFNTPGEALAAAEESMESRGLRKTEQVT